MGRIRTFISSFFLFSIVYSQASFAISKHKDLGIVCPRFPVGSVLTEAEKFFSKDGILNISLTYQHRIDQLGNALYCYTGPNNTQAPTLYLKQGDFLVIRLINGLPRNSAVSTSHTMNPSDNQSCTSAHLNPSSINIHFHGLMIPPQCHKDNVLSTLINSGETYIYSFKIPNNSPPGLYAYHYHVHGQSEAALLGGASGAIIIEGIETVQAAVSGLLQRIIVIRDNVITNNKIKGPELPGWDLSINYIPVPYPDYSPAIVEIGLNEKQFWRVANEGADTTLDIQVQYDNIPQSIELIALDGVTLRDQDGKATILPKTHILLGPLGRAEFIITGPSQQVKVAQLVTLKVDTGPDGDANPYRPIAQIKLVNVSAAEIDSELKIASLSGQVDPLQFRDLGNEVVSQNRTLYFSEVLSNKADPKSWTDFYITVDGAVPTLYNSKNPPSIITKQGNIEDWVIENRSKENHVFHIHQLHFLLLERNNVQVNWQEQQYLDTVQIPYWSGKPSDPYPSIKIRLNFQKTEIGKFVYHCHMLGHEDHGMMAVIEVLPKDSSNNRDQDQQSSGLSYRSSIHILVAGSLVIGAAGLSVFGFLSYWQYLGIAHFDSINHLTEQSPLLNI